jgi:hypothetical protein
MLIDDDDDDDVMLIDDDDDDDVMLIDDDDDDDDDDMLIDDDHDDDDMLIDDDDVLEGCPVVGNEDAVTCWLRDIGPNVPACSNLCPVVENYSGDLHMENVPSVEWFYDNIYQHSEEMQYGRTKTLAFKWQVGGLLHKIQDGGSVNVYGARSRWAITEAANIMCAKVNAILRANALKYARRIPPRMFFRRDANDMAIIDAMNTMYMLRIRPCFVMDIMKCPENINVTLHLGIAMAKTIHNPRLFKALCVRIWYAPMWSDVACGTVMASGGRNVNRRRRRRRRRKEEEEEEEEEKEE